MEISKYVTLEQLWFLYLMILFTSFFKILFTFFSPYGMILWPLLCSSLFQYHLFTFLRTHFDKTTKRLEKELSDGGFEELSNKNFMQRKIIYS